ncbi:MAG TPA: hypothetical protein VIV61_04225 [Candidatus Ozemobacteraceae bacterium]
MTDITFHCDMVDSYSTTHSQTMQAPGTPNRARRVSSLGRIAATPEIVPPPRHKGQRQTLQEKPSCVRHADFIPMNQSADGADTLRKTFISIKVPEHAENWMVPGVRASPFFICVQPPVIGKRRDFHHLRALTTGLAM